MTEAWAVVAGVAGKISEEEPVAVTFQARKDIGDLTVQPSLVFVAPHNIEAVPAFWRQQLAWEQGTYLARIGHRYLSVHFLKTETGKYETYDKSLQPQIVHWLEAYRTTLAGSRTSYPVERVGFGYSNVFSFPETDFDLSRYLKVSFGVGGECVSSGIAAMEINFEMLHTASDSRVNVNVLVRQDPSNSELIAVRTKVEAQKLVELDVPFTEKDLLLREIASVKSAAKDVFFDLATRETHELMGAQYAAK